jgi:hypothetical protein
LIAEIQKGKKFIFARFDVLSQLLCSRRSVIKLIKYLPSKHRDRSKALIYVLERELRAFFVQEKDPLKLDEFYFYGPICFFYISF